MSDQKFVLPQGLTTGPINLDAETGNITTTGGITAKELTVTGKINAKLQLEELDIASLTIQKQLLLKDGNTSVDFRIYPQLLELATTNASFVINGKGPNGQFVVVSNGKELLQVNEGAIKTNAILIAQSGIQTQSISTKNISLIGDKSKAELNIAQQMLELSTTNASFVISNKGINNWFGVCNGALEVLRVDDTEIKIRLPINSEQVIKTPVLEAEEIIGQLSTSDQPNIQTLGNLVLLRVKSFVEANSLITKEVISNDIYGHLLTDHQPHVHSLGVLEKLNVDGLIHSNVGIGIGNALITSEDYGIVIDDLKVKTADIKNIISSRKVIAEYFEADSNYEEGTVLEFGGTADVTLSKTPGSNTVAGIVVGKETAMLLNNSDSESAVLVGLSGIAMCKITGQARKGSLLVSAGDGTAKVDFDPKVGTVIAKSLTDHYGTTGSILVKLMTA